MQRRRIGLIAGALLGALTLVATGSAGVASKGATPKPKVGGTVVFGAEQETAGLNPFLSCCSFAWNGVMVWSPTLAGAFVQQPDFSYKEDLVTKAVITTKPFTVTYFIKPNAVWSDKAPINADDFIFTWQTIINSKFDIGDRTGYDKITNAKKINATTVKFTFKEPFAAWKPLFNPILPKHALQGEDFNKVWLDKIDNPKTGQPIASAAMMFSNWTKGQSLTLVRNPNYWGPHKSYLDKVVFKFVTNTNSEIQAIRGGEVDAIYPQPQLALADLAGNSALSIQSRAGTVLEHIDYQLGSKGGPLERAPWTRQAISYSIDRDATVKQLYKTLNPKLGALQSLVYVSNQKEYVPHFQIYKYDPAKVASLMSAHGCTKGGDGIFSCNGQRMSYKFASTAGNKLRELAFEIIQAQAKNAGIEMTSAFQPASIVFGPTVFEAGNFHMFMYAWVGNGDPQGWNSIYNCGGDSNFKGYCSNKVTQLLNSASSELDPVKRAAIVNQADKYMAINPPALPLLQKPTFLVYKKSLNGLVENPTNTGPTWNIGDWFLS